MSRKTAGETQVAWALLTEGVAQARLETHRLRHLITRAQTLVDKSESKEQVYAQAGDLTLSIPKRLDALERTLDRTSYALSVMGADHLRDRLPMTDRALVDDSTFRTKPFSGGRQRSSSVVAYRYLMKRADLMPPLGLPGGPCHLMHRIELEIRNPKLREELIDDIEAGEKLDNRDAAKIYEVEGERGPGGKWKKIQILPHAQFRMDQRGVTVADLREGLMAFLKAWSDSKSQKGYMATRWEMDMARQEPIRWVAPNGLALIFSVPQPDMVRIITTYWDGDPDPRPVERESCPI